MHTPAHLNYTCKQMHCVCNFPKRVWFSLFTVSQRAAVFVPRMVSLQGTKPQAGRTKCQLSLNAVTDMLFVLLFITKKEINSLPSKQWLVFMSAAEISVLKETNEEKKKKVKNTAIPGRKGNVVTHHM